MTHTMDKDGYIVVRVQTGIGKEYKLRLSPKDVKRMYQWVELKEKGLVQ